MTDTLTRDLGDSATYRAAGRNNPPPLHVRSECAQGAWYPVPRVSPMVTHPGPVMVLIPGLPADEYGEDMTDPGRCHQPRVATPGLVARLDVRAGQRPNVDGSGVRR